MPKFNLDSPPVQCLGRKTEQSANMSWEPNRHDTNDVPTHLFLSPAHSGSTPSTSSNSSQLKKKKLNKLTEETSFIFQKENKTKISVPSKKENADSDAVLSSINHLQECSSSDSENFFASYKNRTRTESSVKSKTTFRTNKVHDFKEKQQSNEKLSSDDARLENRFKALEVPKRDDRYSSPGDSSVDNELKKSMTSVSETSYKDRIRDRFNTVKERAAEALSRPHSRSQSAQKRQEGQRMENPLTQEEYELEAAIKHHEQIKARWQKLYKTTIEENNFQHETSFFMDTEHVSSPPISPSKKVKSSSADTSSTSKGEDVKLFTSDLLGLKEDWELFEYVKPEQSNPKNKKLWEEKLFCPTTKPVSLEDKLEPGLTPRLAVKEGLYVGTKINLSTRLKNKMEQRILMTPEGKKWFDEDGELISSICPLKPVTTRPYFGEDVHQSSDQLIWKSATLSDFHHRYMDLSENLNYILDIDINSIEFSHHPLFSREHVLAQRLKELFIKYKRRKEADTLNRLNGRLNALRRAKDNLKSTLSEGGDNANLVEKLEEYENDIKEVRQIRYVEGQREKQLTNKIVMTWKDLLKLREQQGYECTLIKLNIKKKTHNVDEERAKWNSDLKKEINEILDELKKEYKKALNDFNKNHELWLRKYKKKVTEEKTTENEDLIDRLSDTESANASESEHEEDYSEEEPKPPKPVSTNEVKSKTIEKFKECFRNPDEPELEFILSKASPADTTSHNNKEEMRRAALRRCTVFVKLFYNGKEVCRSKSFSLNEKFTVKLELRLALRILEWPESLMLEIHEETRTLNKNVLVPGIYLPFPDSFTTVRNSGVLKHEFSSKLVFTYNHAAVGSGNRVVPCPDGSEFNNQPVCLYTSGTLAYRLGWVDDQGKILAPPEKYWNFTRDESKTSLSDVILLGGAFDLTKLKDWAEKSKLDPNDPYNSAFFQFLENAGDFESTKPTYFRLNPLIDEFNFCDEKEIENNLRLKLLNLRDLGEPEFADMKMIPSNEKEIHKEMFKEYEKRISTQYTLADILSTDPIDGHRAWGKKYLEQIQQKLLKQCRMSKQNKRYQDIITEENVPDIGTLGLTFMKWLRPKRPLHPVRKERKKIPPQNLTGQEIKIVVNVVRAFEVPVRKDIDFKVANESIEGFSLVNVRPFVEISFQGVTARTTAAEGANPTWNQDLQIPIKNKNGYFSAGNFHSIKDTLYLHLFDEIVIDLIEDESVRETNIHQRLERHWLASMEIPFSTLYFNSRIEGTFKLYSPPILLGYEREAHRFHFSGTTGQEPLLPQRDATYITLFVTVQPALNPPKPIKEKMECSEALNLEKHLENWLQEVTNMFPHRKFKALVLDISGKSICATRFVSPLPLPPIIDEDNISPEMVARFVSMIPLVTKTTIFPGFFDIWLNGDQVLRLLSGDCEDHALLLCCYFLRLGLQAYVLLGSGIPHGFMAYVLVKQTDGKTTNYYVWDPTNGQKYNVDDSFCPLQKVYCIINDQNIWANIQTEEMPRRTKFDLSKRADWFPVFGKNLAAPIGSVQLQSLEYRTTSRQAVDFLQGKIEKKLRDNLMKWRKKSRTQWNRYCAATLRKLLPKLEQSTWDPETYCPNHVFELQHILSSHKICGFPINMAFTRIEAITEAVKATGVHCNEGEGVEFAIAVYIHPYPNNALSVWVYVASLIRRR